MASKQLQFVRSLIISQPPVVSLPSHPSNVSKIENIQGNDLPIQKTLNDPEFQCLGQPSSVLAINSPPSVPIYIRKNSLLAIYGIDNKFLDAIRSRIEFINPFKRFLYGGYIARYQKIISTTPFSLMVSASSKRYLGKTNRQKSFATLQLDGTNDWAVLNCSALQAYSGDTLNVSMFKFPKTISKKLSKLLKISDKTETGLLRWNNLGYSLLSGRGNVGLVGNGSIYNINLKENEEVLVSRKNLLSISVNGPYDLENCIIKYSFPIAPQESEIKYRETIPSLINKDDEVPINAISRYWNITKNYFSLTLNFFKGTKNSTYNFLVGQEDFIRVIGPRSLLLQSHNTNIHSEMSKDLSRNKLLNIKNEVQQKSSDFLNYVTIQPGKGAVFKSTPNFNETVKKIEKKSL